MVRQESTGVPGMFFVCLCCLFEEVAFKNRCNSPNNRAVHFAPDCSCPKQDSRDPFTKIAQSTPRTHGRIEYSRVNSRRSPGECVRFAVLTLFIEKSTCIKLRGDGLELAGPEAGEQLAGGDVVQYRGSRHGGRHGDDHDHWGYHRHSQEVRARSYHCNMRVKTPSHFLLMGMIINMEGTSSSETHDSGGLVM